MHGDRARRGHAGGVAPLGHCAGGGAPGGQRAREGPHALERGRPVATHGEEGRGEGGERKLTTGSTDGSNRSPGSTLGQGERWKRGRGRLLCVGKREWGTGVHMGEG
jgi:hypothetical protein